MSISNRERFRKVFAFEKPDRLPVIEWAVWWHLTIQNWHTQGLPLELTDPHDIRDYFGQDSHRQIWPSMCKPGCPERSTVPPPVRDRQQYLEVKKFLYSKEAVDMQHLEMIAREQAEGESVFWLTFDGPFWYPRTLLGIEEHLLAFYDQPELMKEINEDLIDWALWTFEECCKVCVPDFVVIAEDMSYNHGPMIGRELFEEFISPYMRRLIPHLKERGCVVIVDTDGDVTEAIEWYVDTGVQGFLPLERMAGVDVNAIREKHPDLIMIGAFDKTVMHLGEERMRQEFERLLPVMKQGGYIPGCDHQTPPAVSIDDYRLYLSLLREYCQKAVED